MGQRFGGNTKRFGPGSGLSGSGGLFPSSPSTIPEILAFFQRAGWFQLMPGHGPVQLPGEGPEVFILGQPLRRAAAGPLNYLNLDIIMLIWSIIVGDALSRQIFRADN